MRAGQAFRRPPSFCEAAGPPGALAADPLSVAEGRLPAVANRNAPRTRERLGVRKLLIAVKYSLYSHA